MKNKLELIDKSIDEGYLLSAIEQSKEGIISKVVTDEYKEKMKQKLLSCIEECSIEEFNNSITVKEILSLLNDDKLVSNLSDIEKSKLYASLGDNYFLLGDINKALESFQVSYKLGNIFIFKEIIFIKIFEHFSKIDGEIELDKDALFSLIMNEVIDSKDSVYYMNALENDLETFFVGGDGYLKNIKTVSEYIYNLEATEEFGNMALYNLFQTGDIEAYKKEKNKLGEILSDGYLELYEDSGKDDYILMLREDMIKRFSGENIDYKEYNIYLKLFLALGFDMIEMYFKIGESDKAFSILNTILSLGFSNLGYPVMGFIVENIKSLVGGYEKGENKGFLINPNEYDRLNYILVKNMNLGMPSYETMLDIGDIFLSIGFNKNAFNAYIAGAQGTNKYISKLINLLEQVLFEKDFSNNESINNKNTPEIIISLLLEKLKSDKVLKNTDIDNIYYILGL